MIRESMLIEADELLLKLKDKNIQIFDASLTDKFYRQGHIPGAAFFDHEKFSDPDSVYHSTLLPEAELAARIGELGISPESEVVFYACGMLPYAARAWWVLRYAGHTNVRLLNGGLAAWKEAGGEIEQDVRQYEPSMFEGHFKPGMFASRDEVSAAIGDEKVVTVNVLPRESYEAAHIPGSTCLSCLDLMQDMNYFQANDILAAHLKELPHDKRIITYCGGGIAAAVNAMAHLIIGYENVAVYDGSLFEWEGEGMPLEGTGKWAIWENGYSLG